MLLISVDALMVANLSIHPHSPMLSRFLFFGHRNPIYLAEIHRLATDTQPTDKPWRAALHFKLMGIKVWPLYSGASR